MAALRRRLPLGGKIPEDYVFEDGTEQIKLSELFETEKPSLIIYSFMFGPDKESFTLTPPKSSGLRSRAKRGTSICSGRSGASSI